MKKILTAATIFALSLGANAMAGSHSKTIKMGIILGFTGPIESLTPAWLLQQSLLLKKRQIQDRY